MNNSSHSVVHLKTSFALNNKKWEQGKQLAIKKSSDCSGKEVIRIVW